ncbi:MAG TPA: putative PEP-binding protein, partial [Methanobacterium sp.]|nr:putative PEP-binding protein [Methanobacterium sp.]
LKLLVYVINECNKAGVKTSICGQAGSMPEIVEKLVEAGIESVSANTDAVATVRETVARVEKKLVLKAARKRLSE